MSWTVDGLSYDNRKKITIQNTNINGDLTDFPVLIKIDGDTDIGNNTNADGYDIRFTQSDGSTLLKYERESHTVTAGSLTAYYWVKVPGLSATGTNEIYIYYRSADTADGADPTNVWDANTAARYSMKDLTTSSIEDSIGAHDGTKLAVNEPIEATGKIDKGQDFDGTNDYINIGTFNDVDFSDYTQNWTVDMWVNSDTMNTEAYINIGTTNYNALSFLVGVNSGTYPFAVIGSTNGSSWTIFITSSGSYNTDTWYHWVITNDNGQITQYINNVADGSASISNDIQLNNRTMKFGAHYAFNASYYGDGTLDEIRISDIARSTDWRTFEYYNINEADNELTWGNEESAISTNIFMGFNV